LAGESRECDLEFGGICGIVVVVVVVIDERVLSAFEAELRPFCATMFTNRGHTAR
jgi:hypothetical protein